MLNKLILFLVVIIVGVVVYLALNLQSPSSIPTPIPLPTDESNNAPSPIPTSILSFTPTPISLPFSDEEQPFETIARSARSGHNDRKNYVIKEASEWRSLWDIVYAGTTPKPVLPGINFNNEIIIAVFQGMRFTGGYSIEIMNVIEKNNSLEILVKETSPSPGSFVTQAFTQPFHIVKTKRVDKEIVFRY